MLKNAHHLLALLLFAALIGAGSQSAWARSQVTVSVEPNHISNGDPVLLKVHIESDSGAIQNPVLPQMADWEIVDNYSSRSRSAQIINGNFTTFTKAEFTFVLKPLRKGTLTVPALRLTIGNETKATVPTTVIVDNLPGGANQRPRVNPNVAQKPGFGGQATGNNPYGVDNEDPTQDLMGSGAGNGSANNQPIPTKETFFIRAEPSKTTVYQGELIKLSFALYQRQVVRLDEPSISKFPDFKGFLKEELEIPRNFVAVPVQLQGETLYRSELFKYAVFPLKAGTLTIQSMQFKGTLYPSQADILNSIMNGNVPNMGQGIPMEKYSPVLTIISKPLPPPPSGAPFTGAVGQFDIDLKAPVGPLSVDQPFTLSLTIAGSGNVKSIEEPILDLPQGIEPYQTKNQYEFRPDATGFKSFEYLLLPRKAGKMQIPAMNWTYFDPKAEQYKILHTKAIELNIEGSNSALAQNKNGETPAKPAAPETFGAWQSGAQDFVSVASISDVSLLGGRTIWGAQLLAYIAAIGVWIRKRKQAELDAYYSNAPWARTERRIAEKNEWDNKELAILIDQWTREKIWDLLDDQSLHTESSREDFIESLKPKIKDEYHRHLQGLQQVWSELDELRFTGIQSKKTIAKPYLDKARKALEPVMKSLKSGLK